MINNNLCQKLKSHIFLHYNPNTILWKMLFPWHELPFRLRNYLIRRFGYFFYRNLQYFGEFGYELIAVIPYAYWLNKRNKLGITKSVKDTKCLYYFSKNHYEINIKRKFMNVYDYPLGDIHISKLDTNQWNPPPYKAIYKNDRFLWEKPVCVICNKYTAEWGGNPINFINADTLSVLFEFLNNRYQIIYNRALSKDIVSDDQKDFFLNDLKIIKKKFLNVITIQELANYNKDLTFNSLQMMIYANCEHFISVQGGSSVFASYFGGKNIIFARKGSEIKHNSYKWYFRLSGSKIFHVDNYSDLIKTTKNTFL